MTDTTLATVLALTRRLGPALASRDRAGLVEIITQLVDLRAEMGEQWEKLAQIAALNGELTLGRKAIDRFVASQGGSPAALYKKAGFLSQIGAWGEMRAVLDEMGPELPSPTAQAYSRGAAALYLGDADEARTQLERATKLAPHSGSAWHLLSLAVDLNTEPELAARLVAARPAIDKAGLPTERAAYHHALGKLYAARGAHEAAFAAVREGAALMKAAFPYPRAADSQSAQEATRGWTAERIAAIAATQTEPTARTIFVGGLPRSGTTLVEQILSSHSDVSDGAEIDRLPLLAQETGGQGWAAVQAYADAQGAAGAARLWHHWIDERFPGSKRVVDKSVNSARFLGLAAALLPEAPIIWVTRDPADRAWSCYRICFLNLPWSNDLGDIAHHFALEDALLAQWQAMLGARLLTVPYEALVAEPESWIRRILAHAGLSEEPQVLTPHANARAVTTASVMQVRRPLNRESIGASGPYRAWMGSFLRG